jgi:hypothetical protein
MKEDEVKEDRVSAATVVVELAEAPAARAARVAVASLRRLDIILTRF